MVYCGVVDFSGNTESFRGSGDICYFPFVWIGGIIIEEIRFPAYDIKLKP